MAEYDVMGNYTGYDAGYDYEPAYQPVAPTQSAPSYDDFGNPVYNEEEEKRKREAIEKQIEDYRRQQEELASEVSRKQEITTYADGSHTITTKQEVPAGQRQQLQPVAPDYNQRIAQAESGGRQDIGYHNPQLSSAYGPYGITQGAYEDARRANPNLPQDIRQASPEQMTQAQNAVTQNNARYLQSYGVPVNENTLSAAHFLGAKGLSDFLKTGYISPQAAKANGGEDRVRQIVQKRLGGAMAPASGAANLMPGEQGGMPTQGPQYAGPSQGAEGATVSQPVSPITTQGPEQRVEPADQPRMEPNSFDEFGNPVYSQQQADLDSNLKRFESIQNDPKALMNFEGPDWMKENARLRAADIMSAEREQTKAQDILKNATENDLARYMRSKSDDTTTNRIKGIMYALLNNKEMAKKYADKLDTVGTDKYVTGPDGKPYLLRVRADGELLGGFNAETGAKLTDAELVKVGAGAAAGAGKWQTSAEFFQDKDGNVYQAQHNDKGQTRIVDVKTGAPYQGEAKLERLRDVSGRSAAEQKQQYRRENDLFNARKTTANMEYGAKLKALAEVQQAAANRNEPLLNDQELAGFGVTRPDFENFMKTGQAPARPTPAAVAPQAETGAAPAPAQGRVQAVVPPQEGAAPAPAVQGAPGVPTTGRISVEEQKRQEAQQKLQREAASQVSVDQQKRFNEYVEKDVQPKADAGKLISRVRKEQINGPDGILNNPEIAGMLQGGQGSEVGNILRDLITGNFKDQADLSSRVAQLNLTPRQKEVLYTQIGLNNQILPQTLKANAGPGAISEAEHKINREANVDITRQPLYSGLSLMTRDQFQKDLAVARNDFRSANPDIRTTDDLNKAWNKQERAANEAYDRIYAARAAYIAKHNPNGTNPGVAVDAFRHYPVPTWTGSNWDYGTEYAKKAARPPLGSFNR